MEFFSLSRLVFLLGENWIYRQLFNQLYFIFISSFNLQHPLRIEKFNFPLLCSQIFLTLQCIRNWFTFRLLFSIKELPYFNFRIHYLKNIYHNSMENGLIDKNFEGMDDKDLPLKWRYNPFDYQQPVINVGQ